jgi:hypothetical protein
MLLGVPDRVSLRFSFRTANRGLQCHRTFKIAEFALRLVSPRDDREAVPKRRQQAETLFPTPLGNTQDFDFPILQALGVK